MRARSSAAGRPRALAVTDDVPVEGRRRGLPAHQCLGNRLGVPRPARPRRPMKYRDRDVEALQVAPVVGVGVAEHDRAESAERYVRWRLAMVPEPASIQRGETRRLAAGTRCKRRPAPGSSHRTRARSWKRARPPPLPAPRHPRLSSPLLPLRSGHRRDSAAPSARPGRARGRRAAGPAARKPATSPDDPHVVPP